jgi:NitT/TauT family transport system substrate-binding protein
MSVLALVALSACSKAAAPSGTGAAKLKPATFLLDYLPQGYQAPFFLALDKGFYKAQGIDLKIVPGQGSSSTVQEVAAGKFTFGMASYPVVAGAEARIGSSLIDICSFMQRPPDAIISLKKAPITSISQLPGKTIGYPVGAETVPWSAFLAAAHLDGSQIRRTGLSFSTYYAALENQKVDGLVGWGFADGALINKVTPIAPPLLYTKAGVDMLSEVLIVTKKTRDADASLVAGFVKASIEGLNAAAKDPKGALDAMLKYQPKTDATVGLTMLQQLPYFLHTDASAGHPYCWTAPQDVQATQDILRKYAGLPASVDLATLTTNEFVVE